MTNSPHPESAGISRRSLLTGAGVAAAAAAAVPLLQAHAAEETLPDVAMRSPGLENTRTDTTPSAPPIGVLAFNRMAFGPRTSDDILRMQNMDAASFAAFVEEQLNPAAIDDSELNARIAAENFWSVDKSLTRLWTEHLRGEAPQEYIDAGGNSWRWRNLPASEMERLTFLRATYSRRQLHEVLSDFWFNHFNIFANGNGDVPSATLPHYVNQAIRPHMLGNFRQMLEAVATSPAMLYYLDNYLNQAGGPNENFAREVIELHTMGAENYLGSGRFDQVPGYPEAPIGYVDEDVYEATRAFTGWRVANGRDDLPDNGEFTYYDPWHDRFQKIFLGQRFEPNGPAQFDGRRVLDLLVAHPGTGRYVCRKLCRRFISDTPPENVVLAAAAVFTQQKDAPDQLAQVMRVILFSEEFRSTWGEKIKRPFEVAVSTLRALNAELNTSNFNWYNPAGQELFAWGPPDGYPDNRAYWSSTMPMLHRWNMVNWIIEEGIRDLREDETRKPVEVDIQGATTINTPEGLVDYWIARILGRGMNPDERREVIEFLAQGRSPTLPLRADLIGDLLPWAVALILMSPDFHWR